MASNSRYASTPVIDGYHYGTWVDPVAWNPFGPDILDGVTTVDHVLVSGERLDILSAVYLGDESYWWVIALCNRILDPFSLQTGQVIKIPTDVKAILDKVQR